MVFFMVLPSLAITHDDGATVPVILDSDKLYTCVCEYARTSRCEVMLPATMLRLQLLQDVQDFLKLAEEGVIVERCELAEVVAVTIAVEEENSIHKSTSRY
jgi:hypothetical protein